MVKMIINLVTLEENLKDIHHYVDQLAQEVPGLHDNLTVAVLKDRLHDIGIRLHEAIRQWPQLGMDISEDSFAKSQNFPPPSRLPWVLPD